MSTPPHQTQQESVIHSSDQSLSPKISTKNNKSSISNDVDTNRYQESQPVNTHNKVKSSNDSPPSQPPSKLTTQSSSSEKSITVSDSFEKEKAPPSIYDALTDNDLELLHQLFKIFDRNNDGTISSYEFASLCNAIGNTVGELISENEALSLFKELSSSAQTNSLDFSQFLNGVLSWWSFEDRLQSRAP